MESNKQYFSYTDAFESELRHSSVALFLLC
jgi:hypothetical protein